MGSRVSEFGVSHSRFPTPLFSPAGLNRSNQGTKHAADAVGQIHRGINLCLRGQTDITREHQQRFKFLETSLSNLQKPSVVAWVVATISFRDFRRDADTGTADLAG